MKLPLALLAAALALLPPQSPPVEWRQVSAGIEHAHLTREGPWNINLLRVDTARARLDVVHARDDAVGTEVLSAIAARSGAIAAVNGGYFRMTGTFAGDSTGTLQIDGTLLSEPDRGRAALGLLRDGGATRLLMGHVTWQGAVAAGTSKRRLDGINRPRRRNDLVMFTPGFHATTLTDNSGTEVVVNEGVVTEVRDYAGSSSIPGRGFVLSATGSARDWMRARLTRGVKVTVAAGLRPVDPAAKLPWAGAEDVLGGGPRLITRGHIDITTARERMAPTFATTRHPRTAVASLADGRALLAVVDGRQPAFSVGMTLDELARLLLEFGAEEAINLDGGGSSTMVIRNAIVNRPSDVTGERPISDAILVR